MPSTMPAPLPPITLDARHRRLRLDPRNDLFVQDPYAAYAAVRPEAPAFFWEDYGFWCFASHAGVSALLRDRRFGRDVLHVASRAELGWPEPDPRLEPFLALERGSMLDLEPPQHTRLRGLVNRAFVSREVDRLAPRIAALAHELIDRLPAAGVDLLPAFATPIPLTVIAELLGVPTEHGPDLLAWSHAMVGMYQFGRNADVEAAAVAASEAFTAFLGDLVAERRRAPREDLLTRLVTAEVSGERLTDGEIVGTAVLLLNAGHEATVHAIGNGVKALLETGVRPRGAEQTAGVVEEVLRYDAPLHLFTRFALEDLTYDGISFQRGDKIGLLLGAANRDPDRFPDPDAFRPERSPNPHVAFGAGIHFCLGAPLARLEMQVALPVLFERLPGLAFAAPPRFRDTYHFHGLEELRVAW
jgi:cytochrome P450